MTCNNDFVVIPAIDLRGGRVVRLYQGDYARQTDYAVEPLALARTYAAAGARWLHVVDLDGAQQGASLHVPLLQAMAASGMHIQAGGGVRAEEDLQRLFDAGVSRVVVGSVAMRAPELVISWLQRYGTERITVALDTRSRECVWRRASAGWHGTESATLDELAPRYAAAGARHVLCTDIDRDGTLSGPNMQLYAHLHTIAPELCVQVSGGVRGLEDVSAARTAGAGGIVLGRALLEGRFTLAEALAC